MSCAKWSDEEILQMNKHLMSFATPREINRGARSLLIFKYWKGQEFRNFLCYFGFIAIRDYMAHSHYKNFLNLFCAVRMASSNKYVRKYAIIEKLFMDFVAEFKELNGGQFMTSNIHNVLHIIEDVDVSAYYHRFLPTPSKAIWAELKQSFVPAAVLLRR